MLGFLSTPSARRATSDTLLSVPLCWDFYPRPPRGGRRRIVTICNIVAKFLSTPSARRATPRRNADRGCSADFYPRPPRGGRLGAIVNLAKAPIFLSTPSARRATHEPLQDLRPEHISIHALREEGDRERLAAIARQVISIHALREEGDTTFTPRLAPERYFYPRPPRGGRPLPGRAYGLIYNISIHALREEGDPVKILS